MMLRAICQFSLISLAQEHVHFNVLRAFQIESGSAAGVQDSTGLKLWNEAVALLGVNLNSLHTNVRFYHFLEAYHESQCYQNYFLNN